MASWEEAWWLAKEMQNIPRAWPWATDSGGLSGTV